MFNFKPAKWFSSLLLSKFLKPYVKNFEKQNVDVQLLDGEILIKNLELRNDLLMQMGIEIEIIDSFIGEVKVTIPWNNLKAKSISAEIKDARIVFSNKTELNELSKEQYKENMEKLKREVLQKFDENVCKEDTFSNGQSGGNFLMDLFIKIAEKFMLTIRNLDIVFIYQINNYEIVKCGFGFEQLLIQQDNIKPKQDELRKKIVAENIFLLFEVFDNTLPTQLQPESFIRDQTLSRLGEKKAVHILKKLGLEMEVSILFGTQMEIEIKLATISNVLIYFKQRQIRLLLRAMQDISNHRNDRPKDKPKSGKNAKIWWVYTIKRVIENEFIKSKVKKKGITSYYKAQQYIECYTKKMLKQQKDEKQLIKQMKDFEIKNSITQILILRSMAIDKILEMRNLIRSNNPNDEDNQKKAQGWFKTFRDTFSMEDATNLRFSKKIVDQNLSMIKEKENNTRISLMLDVKQINILIEENQILQHLRNLHQQVNIFKQELGQKKSLQTKVLDHIKNNFLQKITKVTVKSSEINKNDDWKLEELLKEKILINLQIIGTKFELIKQGQFKQLIKAQLTSLILQDTNKFNTRYKNVIEICEGVKILMSSEQLERQKKILDLDPLEKTVQIYLDIQVGPLNITLCKPLYERLISLQNLIFFDKSAPQKNDEEAQKYFDNFLIQAKRIQSNTNISFSIRRINIYLPLHYKIKSKMLLIHLKQIKIFKREHENSVVNIFPTETVSGQVSEYLKDLKTRQTVNRVAQQNSHNDSELKIRPFYITIDCLRLAFVQDYDWEEKENIFKIQYRKLLQNEEINGEPGVETIIETLPIKIRMEQTQNTITLESKALSRRSKTLFKKRIYPKTNLISIQLPFLDIKLSTKHLYMILQLASIWSAKGYDFYDVIDDKQQKKEKKNNSKFISEYLIEDLKNYIMSQFFLELDGVQFNFLINTEEIINKIKQESRHENRLISFNFLNFTYQKEVKFYDSYQLLAIQDLTLQNIHCHNYNLRDPLKDLACSLLNKSDQIKETLKSTFGDELERVMNSQSEIQEVRDSKQKFNIQQQQQQQDQIQLQKSQQIQSRISKSHLDPPEDLEHFPMPQTVFSVKKLQPLPTPQQNNGFSDQNDPFSEQQDLDLFEDELLIKEYYRGPYCNKCIDKKNHRLLLNFMKQQDQFKPDIKFKQINSEKSEMQIELCQLNLVLDPDIIQKMRLIIDVGNMTAEIKKQQFIKWMRENGFWPDFKDVDNKQYEEDKKSSIISSEQVQEKNKITLEIEKVALLLQYGDQIVYLINMNKVLTTISGSELFTKIDIILDQVKLFDTAKIGGKHRTILEDYDENNQNRIQCQIQSCNNSDLIKIRKYATYCGVRIERAKIVFLKRNTNEIQYYIRKVLLTSFSNTLKSKDRIDIQEKIDAMNLSFETEKIPVINEPEFGFKFSLVALSSIGIGYRSSLSDHALYIQLQKVGYWFNGIWGDDYDNLIKSGKFDDEIEKEQEIDEQFFDAKLSCNQSQASQTIYQDQIETQVNPKQLQLVAVWGLEVRCCEGQDINDLFVKAPEEKESLLLSIDFCDLTPDQLFQNQEVKPMRITINIQKLNIYAYDLDYCTICKFFMDNLGEQPQTIIGESNFDEFNENIWMVLDINIEKAIAKFFKGTREDCRNYYQGKPAKDHYLLYKNPASIAIAQLLKLNYQFMMRENGGKFMKLTVQQLTLSDFRKLSTMKNSKEILFSVIEDQFKCDEEQSSSDVRQDEFNKNQINQLDISLPLEQIEELESENNNNNNLNKIENIEGKNIDDLQVEPGQRLESKEKIYETIELQSQQSVRNQKQLTKWQQFIKSCSSIFCCKKKRRRNANSKSKNKSQQDFPQKDEKMTQIIQRLNKLVEYQSEPLLERRWLNFREKQVLPITIKNNNNQEQDDYEYYFDNVSKQDLYFIMKTTPDGEKLIKIKLENKNIILLVDFLVEVVQFFRTPYNGSDKQPYQAQPHFNNFPPMVIQIDVYNVWGIILGDLEKEHFDKSKSIGILLDCNYSQTWLGDSWLGPGSCEKNIDATLKKLFIFQTNHIIELKDDKAQTISQKQSKIHVPMRTLLEPFKIQINMKYSIDFSRQAIENLRDFADPGVRIQEYYEDYIESKKQFQSKNQWQINLINSSKLKNNFSLSIRDIAELQSIINIFQSRKSPEDKYQYYRIPQPEDSIVDNCINTKKINIDMFKIQILKNKDGVKAFQFELTHLKMDDYQDKEKQNLKLIAGISLDYFNKRKMDFEPFLEPWVFEIIMSNQVEIPPENKSIKRDAKKIIIANFIEKQLKGDEVPYYLKDHTNSLNLNITPALVEVTMEALKIYGKQMDDEEPYKIFNRCGYALEIRDIKKDQPVRIIQEDQEYTYSTQKELWNKEFKRHKSDQQQMLLNLVILKPSNQFKDDDFDNEDILQKGIYQEQMGSSLNQRKLYQEQKYKQIPQTIFNNNQTLSTTVTMQQSMMQKERRFRLKAEKNISNYKTIKYVNFDFVGKKFYPLIRQHKNEQQESHSNKKGAMDALKDGVKEITTQIADAIFLTNTKKINEERNIYIQVNVNINPQNGSKEIQIQSTVKIYNYLSQTLELGFQVNGQMKESATVILQPKQIYIVPLEFLENKTEIRFTPERNLGHQQDEQLERKYYQLDTLLCDQQSIGEFEVDKDNSIVEVLEQASDIVTSNLENKTRVIKSEFKQMQDPLNYKYDHVITSMKSNIKRNNFYFVINCVKIKNQITNQKNAFLNFAGTQQKASDYENDVCYETYLICYPIFKFSNATVRDINIHYGILSQKSQQDKLAPKLVQPDQHYYCENMDYNEDMELSFSFLHFKKQDNQKTDDTINLTTPFKIFNRRFGLGEENKLSIKFRQNQGNNIYLNVLIKKRSAKSRELVLYCPYLIFNETNRLLMYQEYGLTKNVISQDPLYYQNFSKTYQKNNKSRKDIEQHSQYHNLHMFSTSTNINKIQFAIGELNDELGIPQPKSKWSDSVRIQNSNVIGIIGSTDILKREHEILPSKDRRRNKANVDAKGKFEFGMAISNGPGSFHRSKLITITPRFIVHNETQHNIAMAQVDTEFRDNNLLRLKPGDWKYFSWSNIKKPPLAMISFYQESTGLISGWSGFFKLQVQEISFKIPSIKPPINNNSSDQQQLYILQKVNITLMDDLILLIRFVYEDPIIPPYFIENSTKYEISYKQQHSIQAQKIRLSQANPTLQNNEANRGIHQVISTNQGGEIDYLQFSAGGNEMTSLQPGERVAFTWDHWIDDKEHVLEVEIEGQTERYEIDKIQNFTPLILPGQSQKKKKITNKKYLYKQGKLKIKDLDKLKEHYCTLNVIKQKLNIYSQDRKQHESFKLQGAKVDESKDNEFVLKINPEKMLLSKSLHFQTDTVEDANQWVDFLWRAILIDKPEMVELKIEPSNQTKVVTFYQNKSNEKLDTLKNDQEISIEREEDSQNQKFTSYKISISNCVGISIIDETPKEIIQVCFKNIQAEYIQIEEQQKDSYQKQNQEDEDNTNLLIEKPQIKQIKEYINLQIDLIIINNQIINSQFPVLLAPNKKKIFGNQQPFFVLQIYRKDQQQIKKQNILQTNNSKLQNKSDQQQIQGNDKSIPQNQQKSKISYIHTLQMFTDTLEIRLDYQILDQIIQYYNVIAAIIWDSNYTDVQSNSANQFSLGSLQKKQEEQLKKIKEHSISKIYLKNLLLEPIDICFTLKSAPGHVMNSSSLGVIADLGLTLASIESAKIGLSSYKTQHIFGSSNEIIGRITVYYKRQFLTQIYKLLGIFGNPVSLISNFGTGVMNMFYEPIYALVTGKSGYKIGEKFFTQAVSLIHTSITGVYNTIKVIIGAIMKLLDQMTLDKKYMSERSNRLNRTIRNFREGFVIGFQNFALILVQTVIGIFLNPIQGINENGFFGFILGIYQGIISIIVKPTVGIYDLLITIIDGIKNTAVYEEHIMDTRYRPPRIFGEYNQLIPFNFKHAIGTDIIRRFKLKVIEGESILFFDQIDLSKGNKKREAQIVLTDIRLVYILSHSSIHCDKIMVYKIKSIKYDDKKKLLKFKLHTPIRKSWFYPNTTFYQLKYDSRIKAEKLMEQIERSFKDRYQIDLKDFKKT